MTLASRRTAAQQAMIDAGLALAALDDQMMVYADEDELSLPEISAQWLDALENLRECAGVLLATELETPGKVKAPWPHPETSQEAAAYMSQYVEKPLGQIWLLIARAHRVGAVGYTCDQVEAETGMRHSTASARFNQLRDTGWIIASGQRRLTRAGRGADVYKPTAFGLESAAQVKGWGWTGEPR